jgi:PAS domain S-box-containing protein
MTISGFFKRPSRAQSASFIAASILIAVIFGANELTLARLRGEILDSTTMNLKSQVIVLASEIDRSLKLLDLSLSSISDQIASFGINDAATLQHKTEGQDFHQLLKDKMVALTHVDAITLISDQGKLINLSRTWPAPEIDVTDRDYYRALKNDASLKSFVGEPVRNRGTGNWTIYLARRLSSPDGHFMGILLGAVAIKSYEEYFQSIALQDGSAVALLRDDGLLLARYPQSNLIGKILPMYAQARKTPLPFTLNLKSPADNQPRLVAAQRLTSFPMGVLVSETEQGALRSWRSFAVISYSTAVAGSLLLLLVLLLMMRWWRKQELLTEEASLRNDRFDAAISNMSQGLCLFDADKKLVIANNRFREIYGLPEDAVRPGTPLSQILQHHVDRGQKSDLSIEQHVQTIPEELNQVFTLADGRVILIKRTPMSSGGWVATHEDITEREQSEMAALKSKALLRSTLTSLSEGVVVQDASGRIISCNPAAERILGVKPDELWGRTSADTGWQAIREDGREFPSHEHPSAMALATGERQNQIVMGLRHDDGSITWISVNSVPLYVAGSTELDTVVTSFSDITARKLAQEVLTEAIAAIPDGFVIFDNNDRLVASNEAYKEIYAASAPAIKPGVTFPELLRYGIDQGQYPEAGETEQQQSKWLAERIGQHRASKADVVQQLSDGRWLQIRERMTPSGYIVGFRTDVTALKRETAKLQAVIDNFPGGISLLDADLNIVACNPAFRGLLDLPDDLFQDGLPSLEMVLRATALRGEFGPGDPDEHVRERMALVRKEGPQLFERTRPNGTVLEIRGTPIKGGGSIRTFMDITARHTAEKQLFDSERRAQEKSATLELTLAHMSQGLSMFDADGQLIVWNDRYAEIYGLSPDLLKQGLNVDAISEYMSQTGYVGTDEPDWRQRLADNDSFAATLRFSDGRMIRIVRTPIEGSGWVATHEDITEQMRAEASLFEQSTELARINMHFDAALSNMTQGLCMFDGERRLLVWNDRYAELYQIPAHLLKVGTPHDAIIADRISRGILKGETGESAARAKIDALGRLPKNETASRVDEFADGRFMLITRQPMADGGWLATHEDITERRRTEAEIVHLARHDVLTGLANRAEFNTKLEEACKRHKRNGGAVTVMINSRLSTTRSGIQPATDCWLRSPDA